MHGPVTLIQVTWAPPTTPATAPVTLLCFQWWSGAQTRVEALGSASLSFVGQFLSFHTAREALRAIRFLRAIRVQLGE